MIPFVLPIVLVVAEDCSLQEYSTNILPILIPAFRIQGTPVITGIEAEEHHTRYNGVFHGAIVIIYKRRQYTDTQLLQ